MESFLQLSQTIVDSPDLNAQECRSWDDLFAPPGQPARVAIEGRYEAEEGKIGKTEIACGFFDLGNHILIVGMVLLVIFVSMNVD